MIGPTHHKPDHGDTWFNIEIDALTTPRHRSERIYFSEDLKTAWAFGVFCGMLAVVIGAYVVALS